VGAGFGSFEAGGASGGDGFVACASRAAGGFGAAAAAGAGLPAVCAIWLTGLFEWRRAACGAAAAAESAAVVWEGDADIFCADKMLKAARPRIIKAATILMAKRTAPHILST